MHGHDLILPDFICRPVHRRVRTGPSVPPARVSGYGGEIMEVAAAWDARNAGGRRLRRAAPLARGTVTVPKVLRRAAASARSVTYNFRRMGNTVVCELSLPLPNGREIVCRGKCSLKDASREMGYEPDDLAWLVQEEEGLDYEDDPDAFWEDLGAAPSWGESIEDPFEIGAPVGGGSVGSAMGGLRYKGLHKMYLKIAKGVDVKIPALAQITVLRKAGHVIPMYLHLAARTKRPTKYAGFLNAAARFIINTYDVSKKSSPRVPGRSDGKTYREIAAALIEFAEHPFARKTQGYPPGPGLLEKVGDFIKKIANSKAFKAALKVAGAILTNPVIMGAVAAATGGVAGAAIAAAQAAMDIVDTAKSGLKEAKKAARTVMKASMLVTDRKKGKKKKSSHGIVTRGGLLATGYRMSDDQADRLQGYYNVTRKAKAGRDVEERKKERRKNKDKKVDAKKAKKKLDQRRKKKVAKQKKALAKLHKSDRKRVEAKMKLAAQKKAAKIILKAEARVKAKATAEVIKIRRELSALPAPAREDVFRYLVDIQSVEPAQAA